MVGLSCTVVGLIVFFLCLIVGYRPPEPALLPLVPVYMALIAVTFTAFGTAIACLIEDTQGFQLIMNFLVMPTFFLSGALFPMESLPRAMTIVCWANPLAYGVDALRTVMTGGGHMGLFTDYSFFREKTGCSRSTASRPSTVRKTSLKTG